MKATLASILVLFACCFASCKQTVLSGGECGDPPPGPPRVPEMRIIDKQTGKDYFIANTSAKSPSFGYACYGDRAINVERYPLQSGSTTYGYAININAVLAYTTESNQCYKLVMKLDNEIDTIQYMYYFEQPCNKAILTGVYSAKYGALVKTPDSVNTSVSYYTLMK